VLDAQPVLGFVLFVQIAEIAGDVALG